MRRGGTAGGHIRRGEEDEGGSCNFERRVDSDLGSNTSILPIRSNTQRKPNSSQYQSKKRLTKIVLKMNVSDFRMESENKECVLSCCAEWKYFDYN